MREVGFIKFLQACESQPALAGRLMFAATGELLVKAEGTKDACGACLCVLATTEKLNR